VRGDVDVCVECLPGSSSQDEPQARGYDRTATGNGERIVPTAISGFAWALMVSRSY
jgi:hypothetical protein